MAVALESNECLGCICCLDACEYGALLVEMSPNASYERVIVDAETCTDCEECVILCSSGALTSSGSESTSKTTPAN